MRRNELKPYSLLVVNSIPMIAVTICDQDLIKLLGHNDRHAARITFYQQARALYDADYEKNKIQSICGVFLISFWWGGPDDQKDSWHWLGIAIGMAQSMGMHRS
jgi:Fungal specific transcription factor domain